MHSPFYILLSLSWYLFCYFNAEQNDSQEKLFLQPAISVSLASFDSSPSCFPDTFLHANLLFGRRFTLVLGNRQSFIFTWNKQGRKTTITPIDREWMYVTDASKASEILLMKLLSIRNSVSGQVKCLISIWELTLGYVNIYFASYEMTWEAFSKSMTTSGKFYSCQSYIMKIPKSNIREKMMLQQWGQKQRLHYNLWKCDWWACKLSVTDTPAVHQRVARNPESLNKYAKWAKACPRGLLVSSEEIRFAWLAITPAALKQSR